MNINKILNISGNIAIKNTWENYNLIDDISIKLENNKLEIIYLNNKIIIDSYYESIFSILLDFNYLTEKFVLNKIKEKEENILLNLNNIDILNMWKNLNLIWIQETYICNFIRPTKFLFSLFKEYKLEYNNIKNLEYKEINYTLLKHDISIANIMFEIMTGNKNNYIVKNFKDYVFNKKSKLNKDILLMNDEKGINIISENEYRSFYGNLSLKANEVYKYENIIKNQILSGIRSTEEFKLYGLFPIATPINNERLNINAIDSYYFTYPDITIPIQRKSNGDPQSIAIEVELSLKTKKDKYINILSHYKNNIKYGFLIYYYSNKNIKNKIEKAYKKLGNLGTCKLIMIEYKIPNLI